MADRITPKHRSWNMSRIRRADTKPEKLVRSVLHRMGYRFRVNQGQLPGSPDIVLKKHRVVIFVHGCYWHRHPGCKYAYTPKSRTDFWDEKFRQNTERDRRVHGLLENAGWRVAVIWECDTRSASSLEDRLRSIFDDD